MKYYIFSAEYWLDQPNSLLRLYPCLKDFGFEIEEKLRPCSKINYEIKKFGYVDICTIEQLMALQKAVDHELIIGEDDDDYGAPSIMIYDDYIE